MTQKVYVIRPTVGNVTGKPAKGPAASPAPGGPPRAGSARNQTRIDAPPATVRDRWARVLRAYLLGPVALVLWPAGRLKIAWAALGAGSVVASAMLLAGRSSFAGGFRSTPNGALLWIVTILVVTLAVATAWARAVALAGRDRPTLAQISSRRWRRPAVVGALGTLLPGFGLLMTGRYRRAALSVWMVGPLAAAVAIVSNWRWLWARGQSPIPPGISGTGLEIVFVAAAGLAVLLFFALVVVALDGARRFSAVTRSRALADTVGVALVVAVALFAATFRPAAFGRSLGAMATTLHRDGFRVIPLALYETAARLDPATPAHLADAAVVDDELGWKDAAAAKRRVIERRMREYVDVVRNDRFSRAASLALSSAGDNPLEATARTEAAETWNRIRGLLRPDRAPSRGR